MTHNPFACETRIDGHLTRDGTARIVSGRNMYLCSFCGVPITSRADHLGRYRWAGPPVFEEEPIWDDL